MDTTLPGRSVPYLIRSGSGHHYAGGGQLVSVIARHEDTDGLLEAAIVSAGRGAGVTAHRHTTGHEVLMVLEGAVDLHLVAGRRWLAPGDFASVPPGAAHAYRMVGHVNRLIRWSVGGELVAQVEATATRTEHSTHDERATAPVDLDHLAARPPDLEPVDPPPTLNTLMASDRAPVDAFPYVLELGAGERLLAGDQVFTFLADRRHTGGRFIVLSTMGAAGERIPRHFHREHTETFFCTSGRMTMWAAGEEIAMGPGDFLHVPAGTEHAYRLDAPYTRFVGVLTPGLFEPFFRAMCEPFDGIVNPPVPGPIRFDRVMQQIADLDLVLTEQPPGAPGR